MSNHIQKVLFGGPGTGKSFKIIKEILPSLLNINDAKNVIHTVFHPDYTYGDFMGKLLPLTEKNSVTYKFYKGDFLKALAQAYKNLLISSINGTEVNNVALVIDEINRGNAPAVFGKVFQLLDREDNGWSSYRVNISKMEFDEFLNSSGVEYREKDSKLVKWWFENKEIKDSNILDLLENQQIKIPYNLSILATMNTSDNTIFYMDSAFKRRWEWEFIDIKKTIRKDAIIKLSNSKNEYKWYEFIDKLNLFIEQNHEYIRDVDSKQIGYWFLKENIITEENIKNKLMFFLWDSVFVNTKKPLTKLLGLNKDLVTFSSFTREVEKFIEAINKY